MPEQAGGGDINRKDYASLSERLAKDVKFREKYGRVMNFIRYNQPDHILHRSGGVGTSKSYEDILQHWDIPGGASILDIGAGAGHELDVLKKKNGGARIAVAFDRVDYRKNEARGDMVLGYVDSLPFGQEAFDAIHCKDVLVHVANQAEFIERIVQILKPGGKLLITTSETKINYFPLVYDGFNVMMQAGAPSHVYSLPFSDLDDFLIQAVEYIDLIKKGGGDKNFRLLEIGMPYFQTSVRAIIESAVVSGLRTDQQNLPINWKHEHPSLDWSDVERFVLPFVKIDKNR